MLTGIHPEGRGQRCDFRAAIPATFDAMEKVFTEFRRHWKPLMPRGDCFACELLLREALTNAVVHPNHMHWKPANSIAVNLPWTVIC